MIFRRKKGRYDGPVAFCADGFHYAVKPNGQHTKQPLVWVNSTDADGGHFEWAARSAPSHFHTYGMNPVDLEPK